MQTQNLFNAKKLLDMLPGDKFKIKFWIDKHHWILYNDFQDVK